MRRSTKLPRTPPVLITKAMGWQKKPRLPIALITGPQTRDSWAGALNDQSIAVRAQADTRAEELEQQTRARELRTKAKPTRWTIRQPSADNPIRNDPKLPQQETLLGKIVADRRSSDTSLSHGMADLIEALGNVAGGVETGNRTALVLVNDEAPVIGAICADRGRQFGPDN